MRFLVVVSAGAALAFIAASGLMNWVFMTRSAAANSSGISSER